MLLYPALEVKVVRRLFRRVHVLLLCRVLYLLRCDGGLLRHSPHGHPCSAAGALRPTRSSARCSRGRSIFETGIPRIRGARCSFCILVVASSSCPHCVFGGRTSWTSSSGLSLSRRGVVPVPGRASTIAELWPADAICHVIGDEFCLVVEFLPSPRRVLERVRVDLVYGGDGRVAD